jgi:hypothetical protein
MMDMQMVWHSADVCSVLSSCSLNHAVERYSQHSRPELLPVPLVVRPA